MVPDSRGRMTWLVQSARTSAGVAPEDRRHADAALLEEIRQRAAHAYADAVHTGRAAALKTLAGLRKEASTIGSPYLRGEAFGKIALTEAALHDFREAERTATLIESEELRLAATMLIDSARNAALMNPHRQMRLEAEIGDIASAIQTSHKVEDSIARSYALEAAATQQAKSGDSYGALRLAEAIPDIVIRTTTLGRVARILTRHDDLDVALHAVQAMADASSRDEVLLDLVDLRLRKRDLDGARTLAGNIADHKKQSWASGRIGAFAEFTH